MGNKLQRIFNPTKEEREEDMKRSKMIHEKLSVKRECSTCNHCVHVRNYPGYVTAEECECNAGLICDTVLFSVENCPLWEDRGIN